MAVMAVMAVVEELLPIVEGMVVEGWRHSWSIYIYIDVSIGFVVSVHQCITTIDGRQSSVSFASRESGVSLRAPG